MEPPGSKPGRAAADLVAAALFAAQPHLAVDRAWLARVLEDLPDRDRAVVARVAAAGDLDGTARALGVTRRRFDGLWAELLVQVARRARDDGALRRGEVGERERSLARHAADYLGGRGWDARLRGASVAAISTDHRRLAAEAAGVGKWAFEAAIGEARSRASETPGVRPGLVIESRDARALRALLAAHPGAAPDELAVFVVEGAFVREVALDTLAARPAPMPRGPFAGRRPDT